MKCFRCGAEIPGAARFCASCGTVAVDPHDATVVIETEDSEALFRRVRMVLEGEFDVERELARGGMGVIFKATEVGLRRSVALKVLPPELGLNVRSAERFKREARMVAELDHPNIIPVYRVGQLGGIFFIAMKFIEGRSLGLILDTQGALPVPVTLQVLRGATRGLAYAHDRHIIHRDIKGGNILVDQDGRVMVSDFGVALRAADVNLTADGTVIGTPPFMSPEQCAGRRTGPQSDQYSIGIVGFQMLTGAVPFRADTIAGMMQHHFFTPAPDVRQARDDVPPALAEVLNRTLQKDPAARYADPCHARRARGHPLLGRRPPRERADAAPACAGHRDAEGFGSRSPPASRPPDHAARRGRAAQAAIARASRRSRFRRAPPGTRARRAAPDGTAGRCDSRSDGDPSGARDAAGRQATGG